MANHISLMNGNYLYFPNSNTLINNELKNHYEKHESIHNVNLFELKIDEQYIKGRIENLPIFVLEVTEQCNLRCKYCVYNGEYDYYRPQTAHSMSLETARKGIDYIYSFIRNRKDKTFTISLYGGEPLLDVDKLNAIVEYSKEVLSGWELNFSLTSNLTKLDEKAIDFLLANNVRLCVSLDGNQENHDAKRVFSDGTGSHEIVMKNLEKLYKLDPEYFKNISFSAVHSFDLPLKSLIDFYSNNPLVSKNGIRYSTVSQFNTTYNETFPFDIVKLRKGYSDLYKTIFESLRKGIPLPNIVKFLFSSVTNLEDALEIDKYPITAQSCLFDSRIFLDSRGQFHICERINNSTPIGNVGQGFNFSRMVQMVDNYVNIIKRHCLDCNVRFLCERCFVLFAENGTFKMPENFCESKRKSIKQDLERYIQLKEEGLI